MAVLTKAQFDTLYNSSGSGAFLDNSTQQIVEATMRAFAKDIEDSVLFIGDSSAGSWIMKGSWDASTNVVPSSGDISVKEGFTYENGNHTSTTLLGPDGNVILPYATIRALQDNPGVLLSDPTKWRVTY